MAPPGSWGSGNVEFREGLAEALPVEDGWADVVISNGVFNLCADKRAVFGEVWRVLRPGGVLQFADIANGNPVPAGGDGPDRPVDRLNRRWPAVRRLEPRCCAEVGFLDVTVGPPVDTFGGAHGEPNARAFDVNGYPFMARKPRRDGPSGEVEPGCVA